ncbi:MAG: hypothetical protein ACI89L_001733 [Phycisphaerales bacterium]|jgi:hypothetical protein
MSMRTTRLILTLLVPSTLLLASCAQPTPATSPTRVDVSTPPKQTQPVRPAIEPAVQPAVQATESTPPATTPEASDEAETRWWMRTPAPVVGQLRVIASGSGAKLMDAREQAVSNARDLLARSLGHEPEDSTIERTAAEENSGVYTAWVMISTPNSP